MQGLRHQKKKAQEKTNGRDRGQDTSKPEVDVDDKIFSA
jgi:hypothetical protein